MPEYIYFYLPFVIVLLIIKIIFSITNNYALKFFFTPLTTIAIVFLPLYKLYQAPDLFSFIIVLAFIFSLTGDFFNMLKDEHYYIQFGMIFFIITHALFMYNFSRGYTFSLIQVPIALVLIGSIISSYNMFKPKLDTLVLKIGIVVYMVSVSGTFFFGISRLFLLFDMKSWLIGVGGLLFLLSDFFLGLSNFKHELKAKSLIVWGLYAPAQILIALSCYY